MGDIQTNDVTQRGLQQQPAVYATAPSDQERLAYGVDGVEEDVAVKIIPLPNNILGQLDRTTTPAVIGPSATPTPSVTTGVAEAAAMPHHYEETDEAAWEELRQMKLAREEAERQVAQAKAEMKAAIEEARRTPAESWKANALAKGIATGAANLASNLVSAVPVTAAKVAVEGVKGTAATLEAAKEGLSAIEQGAHTVKEVAKTVEEATGHAHNAKENLLKTVGSSGPKQGLGQVSYGNFSAHELAKHLGRNEKKKPKKIGGDEGQPEIPFVRFGDHSIECQGVATMPACDYPIGRRAAVGNWFRNYSDHVFEYRDWFVFGATGQIEARSRIAKRSKHNEPRNWVDEQTSIFEALDSPAAGTFRDHHVFLKPGIKVGSMALSTIAEFTTGGYPDDKKLSNVLNGKLHITQPVAIKELAARITASTDYYDNSYIYCKLFFQALLDDHYTMCNIQPVADQLNLGSNFDWQNMMAAIPPGGAFAWQPLINAIDSHRIMFVLDEDFTLAPQDMAVLYYLANTVRSYSQAAGAAGPSAKHLTLAGIPITLLANQALPGPPAGNLMVRINGSTCIAFAMRMATRRGEDLDMMRGLYQACQIYALHMPEVPEGNAAAQRRCRNVFYGVEDYYLPAPKDYNFLLRLLGLRQDANQEARDEVSAWANLYVKDRLLAAAGMCGMIQASVTTVLNGYNIGRDSLRKWSSGINFAQNLEHNVVEGLNSVSRSGTAYVWDAMVILKTYAAFEMMTGLRIPDSQFPGWRPFGEFDLLDSEDQGNQAYNGLQGRAIHAPRKDTLLGLLNWVKTYPCEWVTFEGTAKINIDRECIMSGVRAAQGWYSQMGEKAYKEASCGKNPIKFISYGAQVASIMEYINQAANFRTIWFQRILFTKDRETANWSAPALFNQYQPEWNGGTQVIEPCTWNSYDYDEEMVIAPVVLFEEANNAEVEALPFIQMYDIATTICVRAHGHYYNKSGTIGSHDLSDMDIFSTLDLNQGQAPKPSTSEGANEGERSQS